MHIQYPFKLLLTASLTTALIACGSAGPTAGNPATPNPGAAGNIVIENADLLPYGDRLVFSQIGRPTYSLNDGSGTVLKLGVHDRITVRVKNSGTAVMDITGLNISGPWQLENAPALPVRLSGGESRELQLRFTASGPTTGANCVSYTSKEPTGAEASYQKCTFSGTLSVAAGGANKTVQLAGFWQPFPEGDHEPTLQQIVDLFGYKTILGTTTSRFRPYGEGDPAKPYGEEVISAYWQRADATKPVSVQTLAMFHGRNSNGTLQAQKLYWFNEGDAVAGEQQPDASGNPKPQVARQIMEQTAEGAQMFRPRQRSLDGKYTLAGLADVTFQPAGAFGLRVQDEYSVAALNTQSNRPGATLCNKFATGSLQVRFWPLRDRDNKVVPDTYLVGMDAYCDNYDYNDNVYLITNIKPK
ncbi:hypothetical protein [Deinococcus peraridilitoris]|uniref:Abnormal spindle-like microcephaly-associated protein ASH domain-containing protein n=1 Tax=Deinococcus peraridilitoris (strain DSM 19664 / LMG 22246 / CIP 109416 / KR-200) TaxID=937777 RepID=L0A5F7_DEIPD|nr:hypothetical protein [Deinococcus peraridilitoris]AFZ68255.1 hypothetical protein Deipe_2791 [Deinococcus peraridilitoris DSM 19664]